MSPNAIDFFNPLSPFDGVSILKNCVLEQVQFAIAVDLQGTQAVINTRIDNRLSVDKFYLVFATNHQVENRVGSFSFKLGTRIFFFKSDILKDEKGYYITDKMTIFELRRRRHERFNIPQNFAQTCTVFLDKGKEVKAHIVDISVSGIRLYITGGITEFLVDGRISFLFQVEKRGEVMCQGLVRFAKRDPRGLQILGIEFVQLTALLQSKIQNVCEDLERNLTIRVRK
jgi:PilZ domain